MRHLIKISRDYSKTSSFCLRCNDGVLRPYFITGDLLIVRWRQCETCKTSTIAEVDRFADYDKYRIASKLAAGPANKQEPPDA